MRSVLILGLVAILLWPAGARGAADHRTFLVGGKPVSVTLIQFPLKQYRLGVALAGTRIGDNGYLLDIARRAGALCAINGTFLAAYGGETGEPYGTIVVNGRVLHLGAVGTRLDILATGAVRLQRDALQIRGALDGNYAYPCDWYAYNINQSPSPGSTAAYLYTPERGSSLGFRAELAVVARRGIVAAIVRGQDLAIPADGFVLVLQGKEVDIQGWKFSTGQAIEYRVDQKSAPFEARFSLGAGPRLIQGGTVHVDPVGEGFVEAQIISLRQARSAVGFSQRGDVIFAAMDHATVSEAASIMKTLGAVEAMNLDGGASSGLVCEGTYLVRPGRPNANALVLWPANR